MLKQREQVANLAVQQEQEEQAVQSFTPYFSMIDDEEVLQSREKFMKTIQTFLQKFSRYPFGVMPRVLLIAWEIFFEIKHAFTDEQYQPEKIQELMCKLLKDSSASFPIFEESDNSLSDNSLPKFETFSDHTEETRSGNTTTHANNSLPEYDSFCFEIEPDQERLTSVVMKNISDDSSNDPILEEVDLFLALDNSIPPGIENIDYDSEGDIHFLEELLVDDSISLPENESYNFDHQDDPLFPRPPLEPPDVEFLFNFETNLGEVISALMNNIDKLDEDECFDPVGEIYVFANV
nr:hypothetical protein [Tanacetum cinerariifolium]